MIFTWSGAHVKKLSAYTTTDEKIKELTEGMFAVAKIFYPDTKEESEKIVNIASLKADDGWQEIQDALKN
jgi:hypothetical protein